MTGHGTLIIVSVYLPPHKPVAPERYRNPARTGDAVILFGDLNSKIRTGGVVLSLNSTRQQCLPALHLPVLLKPAPPPVKIQISLPNYHRLKRVSTALEEVDTPNLNVIDDIVSNNDIDTAIGALTKHIRSVVKRCQRKVPEFRSPGLPADVRELIRAKTQPCAARAHTPLPNRDYSSHKAYWAVAKALKSDECVACLPSKPDNDLAFDDQEKAEYLADSIELQCSLNPPRSRTRKPRRKRSPP
ncbi:hypothetical protein EVAR_85406_1 [Eumeta japonica]|uniref:RNA-directed DNA polymerase from mobile element jockey n=1 Tax=Eumeta variegata TaxID=151549 RepID=A0A4C1WM45_EUMVA|nr:hypothetical protein EVAR_85406_1 [Eumeta japonica]